MKRLFLISIGLLLAFSFVMPACKKPVHETHPTPNNTRLWGYTIIGTTNDLFADTVYTINDNYRFYYDNSNRVSRIIITSNFPDKPHQTIYFEYKADTIFKTYYNLATNDLMQRDTFIQNSQGFITTAFSPKLTETYEYYGKLLARYKKTARDTNVLLTASTTYTSYEGNLLKQYHDGQLSATFQELVGPLDRTWWYYGSTLIRDNPDASTLTDVLAGYTGLPTTIVGVDVWGNVDTADFPGIWLEHQYEFDKTKLNRTGDYLQLQSFSRFGANVYQNKNLVNKIYSPGRVTEVVYGIDADSKISSTHVFVTDSFLNTYNYKYELQYETY
jgi:hypothetical protein